MKNLIVLLAFTLSSFSVFAASEKICFGTDDVKGSHFVVQLTKTKAVIKQAHGDDVENTNGSHKLYDITNGRDGKKYYSYFLSSLEGITQLLVDEALLKPGTKGYAKIRWTGEGYSQTSYFCKDNE